MITKTRPNPTHTGRVGSVFGSTRTHVHPYSQGFSFLLAFHFFSFLLLFFLLGFPSLVISCKCLPITAFRAYAMTVYPQFRALPSCRCFLGRVRRAHPSPPSRIYARMQCYLGQVDFMVCLKSEPAFLLPPRASVCAYKTKLRLP